MTAKATKLKRMSQGLCYGCGERPPEPDKLQCESCLQRQREQYEDWYKRQSAMRAEDRRNQAAAIESMRATINETIEPKSSVAQIVTAGEIVRVSDPEGKPILAIIPWPAYVRLLKSSSINKHPKKNTYKRPVGRPPLPDSHILKGLIRNHPELSRAEIATLFQEKTGQIIERSTVGRYRKQMKTINRSGPSLDDYHDMILEAAIKAGARPETAKESEEYADGLVALYEAAQDFTPGENGDFREFARIRIKKGIADGYRERKGTGRVRNFSEIGNQNFDFASIIDEDGRAL